MKNFVYIFLMIFLLPLYTEGGNHAIMSESKSIKYKLFTCRLLKGKSNMKFKTRLRVTFISIILLPLLLTIMAFVMIAIYLMNYSQGLSLTDIDYSMMSENFREFTNTTDQGVLCAAGPGEGRQQQAGR